MGAGGLWPSGGQLERDQSNAFQLAGSPEAQTKQTASGLSFTDLRPKGHASCQTGNAQDSVSSSDPGCADWKLMGHQYRCWTGMTDLLETGLCLCHSPLRRESPYLPPWQTGARCGSSEGLPLALHSELSPSPEPPSAHCTAEEPVWAKQGPLSVD